jgi:hypothetical protein
MSCYAFAKPKPGKKAECSSEALFAVEAFFLNSLKYGWHWSIKVRHVSASSLQRVLKYPA